MYHTFIFTKISGDSVLKKVAYPKTMHDSRKSLFLIQIRRTLDILLSMIKNMSTRRSSLVPVKSKTKNKRKTIFN